MEDESWTGVKLQYVCPNCGKPGGQTFVIEAVGWDQDKARIAAWAKRSPCALCRRKLPENMDMGVDIIVAPLERLRQLGYPAPSVH